MESEIAAYLRAKALYLKAKQEKAEAVDLFVEKKINPLALDELNFSELEHFDQEFKRSYEEIENTLSKAIALKCKAENELIQKAISEKGDMFKGIVEQLQSSSPEDRIRLKADFIDMIISMNSER